MVPVLVAVGAAMLVSRMTLGGGLWPWWCGVVYNSNCKTVNAVAAAAVPPGCCSISSLHSSQEEYLLQSSQMLTISARNSGGKDVLSSFDTFYSMKCVEFDQVLRRLGNASIFTTRWNASLPLNSVIRENALMFAHSNPKCTNSCSDGLDGAQGYIVPQPE